MQGLYEYLSNHEIVKAISQKVGFLMRKMMRIFKWKDKKTEPLRIIKKKLIN